MTDDLAQVLDDVHEFAARFIAYPTSETAPTHALWIAHAHVVDAFENTPRLAFLSPEPGSGKSRAMEITEALVPRPVLTVNATVPYVFRKISDPDGLPTLLMDEADAVFSHKKADGNEDLRGLLNSGYRKGATTGRISIRGNELIPEDWPSYCAVALAGLGNLPDTLMTRSIVVAMKKRRPDQVVQPYRRRRYTAEAQALADRIARATAQHFDELREAWPELPEGIEDRDADIWEPLIAIADAAGGHWPDTARAAAVTLVSSAKAKPATLGVRLLEDVRTAFGDHEAMTTADLLAALLDMDASPWASIKDRPIDARFLASMLGKYDVPTNKTVRTPTGRGKGYRRDDLFDAWARYLPPLLSKVGDKGDSGDSASQAEVLSVTPFAGFGDISDTRRGFGTDVTDNGTALSPTENAVTRHVTPVTDVTDFSDMGTGDACRHGFGPRVSCGQCLAERQGVLA